MHGLLADDDVDLYRIWEELRRRLYNIEEQENKGEGTRS